MSKQPQNYMNQQARRPSPNRGGGGHQHAQKKPPVSRTSSAENNRPTLAVDKGVHKVTPMTQPDISRIMSAVAKQHGGAVPKGSYVADMQSRLDRRESANSSVTAPASPSRQDEAQQRRGQKKR